MTHPIPRFAPIVAEGVPSASHARFICKQGAEIMIRTHQMLFSIVTLAILGLFTTSAGAATFAGLTNGNSVEIFDGSGTLVQTRDLSENNTYIAATYGDLISSNPGNEFIALRNDNNIDIYGDVFSGSGELSRIAFNGLASQSVSERTFFSLGSGDFGNAGTLAIMFNDNEDTDGPGSGINFYTPQASNGSISRNDFQNALDAGGAGNVERTIVEGGDLTGSGLSEILAQRTGSTFGDYFPSPDDAMNNNNPDRLGNFQTTSGVMALEWDAASQTLLSFSQTSGGYQVTETVFDGSSFGTPSAGVVLDTDSTLLDVVVVPEPGSLGLLGAGALMLLTRKSAR